MPWVTFVRDFDWPVPGAKSATTIAYKAGMRVLVKKQCAEDAAKVGALDGARESSPCDEPPPN